jgi:hypothetical protein
MSRAPSPAAAPAATVTRCTCSAAQHTHLFFELLLQLLQLLPEKTKRISCCETRRLLQLLPVPLLHQPDVVSVARARVVQPRLEHTALTRRDLL